MKSKKQKASPSRRQNTFTLTSIAVIVLVCAANLYGAFLNLRFIHAPLDVVYYFRFIALLGGGFAAGYLLTPKGKKKDQDRRLFAGVAYALLATALYYSTDIVQAGLRVSSATDPAFQVSRWLFLTAPLIALAITAAFAFFAQYRRRNYDVAKGVKVSIATLFAVYFVHILIVNIFMTKFTADATLWQVIGGYLVMPPVIATICYAFLGTVKPRTEQIFYSTLIALLYTTLLMVWPDVRTDASERATMTVWYIALALSLSTTALLVWQARRLGTRTSRKRTTK